MLPRPSISVVVPCLNEEANLPAMVARVLAAADRAGVPTEIVLVDDGSIDRTWGVIEQLRAANEPHVRGVRHAVNRGIAFAWKSGVDSAAGDYVAFIDADLQNPPEEIFTLHSKLLASQADIAQGVRSSIDRVRGGRYLTSRALNLLLNAGFGMRSQDNKSGFILGPRFVIADIVASADRYRHFQTFIGPAAKARGYSILEVETLFQDRHAGTSFLAGRSAQVTAEVLGEFPRALREFGGWRARRRYGRATGAHITPLPVALTARLRREAHITYTGWRRVLFESYFASMPAHKWLIRRRARALYAELAATQWWDRADLAALQDSRLSRLIQHAYAHVPYYRQIMDEAGLAPGDIKSVADLGKLPLLGKQDVREHLFFDLFADDHRKSEMHRIATSGSTGEPFVTFADRFQLEMRFATTLRALEWTGWRFGDRQARLWHQTLGMTRSQVVRERIDAWFMRRKFIPAFELSEARLADAVDQLVEHQPVLLDGYAESLNFLAAFIAAKGNPGLHPAGVMSSAQALPGQTREQIESALSTRVYDKYGSREFSGIAYECGHGNVHHVMDESYVVELLVEGRPARPGEVGEIVITDLNNFSVPLIRYRVGDLALAVDATDPCPCGRGRSRIGPIQGRSQALVHCADGTWLPGTFFAHFFKDYEYLIQHFQIVQEEPGSFTLRVVPGQQFTERGLSATVESLRGYTGHDTRIDVDLVDEIPLVRTGKRTPVVSSLRVEFQEISGDAHGGAGGGTT